MTDVGDALCATVNITKFQHCFSEVQWADAICSVVVRSKEDAEANTKVVSIGLL